MGLKTLTHPPSVPWTKPAGHTDLLDAHTRMATGLHWFNKSNLVPGAHIGADTWNTMPLTSPRGKLCELCVLCWNTGCVATTWWLTVFDLRNLPIEKCLTVSELPLFIKVVIINIIYKKQIFTSMVAINVEEQRQYELIYNYDFQGCFQRRSDVLPLLNIIV